MDPAQFDPSNPVAWMILLGAGAILRDLVSHVIDELSGRTAREASAWEQRDMEARARRILEEELHEYRVLAIKQGVSEDDLPPWPEYKTTKSPKPQA